MYVEQYGIVYQGNETWNAIPSGDEPIYNWKAESTYIQEPPFFVDLPNSGVNGLTEGDLKFIGDKRGRPCHEKKQG